MFKNTLLMDGFGFSKTGLKSSLCVCRLNEILYPHYNETRVKEIITKYETDQLLIQRKAIGKEGFTRFAHF
jgi:hypothetical protein